MERLFEDVRALARHGASLETISREVGVGEQKVRKILISLGLWNSPLSLRIAELYGSGNTPREIATLLKLSNATVNGYLPYSRGPNLSESPSANALRIRRCRERKRLAAEGVGREVPATLPRPS